MCVCTVAQVTGYYQDVNGEQVVRSSMESMHKPVTSGNPWDVLVSVMNAEEDVT